MAAYKREQTQKVFIIPVNSGEDETSVTLMRVDCGKVSMRVAKRKLRVVLTEWGIPKKYQKIFIKELTRD